MTELLQIKVQARFRQTIVQQPSSCQKHNDRMKNRSPKKLIYYGLTILPTRRISLQEKIALFWVHPIYPTSKHVSNVIRRR
jgi:hypothetical protein